MRKIVVLILLFPLVIKAQTVHLIIVADYEDPKFGVTSIADEERIFNMFTTVKSHLKYKLSTTYLFKNTFTSKDVLKTISKLRSRRRDIIVFYYSGKGFYPSSSNSAFPHFQLNDAKTSPLALDEVAKLIDRKREALGLVIADCRDTLPTEFAILASITFSEDWIGELITQKLFLGACGIMKVASGRENKPVFTTHSGASSAFTAGFTSSYNNMFTTATIDQLDEITLFSLIGRAFSAGNSMSGHTQIGVTETLPCDNNRRNVAMVFPSYKNVFSYGKLSSKYQEMLFSENASERKKLGSELLAQFAEGATVNLKIFKEGSSQPVSEQRILASVYLQSRAAFDPNLMNCVILSHEIKRTPDFTKIVSAEIQERIK